MKVAQQGRSAEVRANMSKAQLSSKVIVTDITTGTKTTYHAIRAAARALGIDKRYIRELIQRFPFFFIKKKIEIFDITFELIRLCRNKNACAVFPCRAGVTDLASNQKTVYSSITLAARALGVRQSS